MKPKLLHVPAPVHHRPSGQDVVFVRGAEGRRRMVYLGAHGSTEAARRYREVLATHLAGKPLEVTAKRRVEASEWPTVAQLCAAFLLDAERYYVDAAGNRSREVDNFRLALRALLTMQRDTATERFTINDLIAVRQALIDGDYGYQTGRSGRRAGIGGRKRSRTYVNASVRRIKQVFRWGTERRMVPGSVWHELSALRSLPIGRCAACETQPDEARPWGMVEPVLEHLPGPLATCVRLQWCTRMRRSEALQIQLARTERIEVARIALAHKNDRVTRRYAVGAELEMAVAVARRHGKLRPPCP